MSDRPDDQIARLFNFGFGFVSLIFDNAAALAQKTRHNFHRVPSTIALDAIKYMSCHDRRQTGQHAYAVIYMSARCDPEHQRPDRGDGKRLARTKLFLLAAKERKAGKKKRKNIAPMRILSNGKRRQA